MVAHGVLIERTDLREIDEIATLGERTANPVTFDGCFGWLHPAPEGLNGDVAVLICPALSRDALDSHHAMRLLADEFAAAGYPAMRFHYPGTGDSCDVAFNEVWSAWLKSVHTAADWLRTATGARRIVFCGLRIGATLAALAAEARDDVAGLLLLAPVLRGRSYIRQLSIEVELQTGVRPPSTSDLELYELHLSAETLKQISQLDLQQVRLAAGVSVGLFFQSPSKLITDCSQCWERDGAHVTCRDFSGLEPMLHPNLRVEDVPADFTPLIAWIRQAVPAEPMPLSGAPVPDAPVLQLPGCSEVPLRFGAGERLFGLLCRPHQQAGNTAVIICNAGRDPHYGSGRFGVEFARGLAAAGVASFRIDFEGLGDSIGLPGRENILSPLFETDRSPDISAAIDALEPLGYDSFAVHGLCAGAYHALHGALADSRISTLLLINMPVFSWRDGDTIDFVRRKTSRPLNYLQKLLHKDLWHKVRKGQVDMVDVLRAQCERLWDGAKNALLHIAEKLGHRDLQSFPRRAMATLSRRHARTLFLFAPGDNGIDAVEQQFGRNGVKLRAFNATMTVVPALDHMLSGHEMRRIATDLMVSYLKASPELPGGV